MKKQLLIALLLLPSTKIFAQSTAYVANPGGNNVIPINTTTNTAGTPIFITGGASQKAVAITPDNKYVYIANGSGGDSTTGSVSAIATSNNTIFTTIQDPSFINPNGIAIAPNGIAYVANAGSTTVSYFQTGVMAPVTVNTFSVGNNPLNCAITPNGQYIYVTNASGTVSVYDISGPSPVFFATIGSGTFTSPEFLAITPDGSTVYMTDASGKVFYFATGQTNPTLNTITVGNQPQGIAITSDGFYAYVANNISNTVSMISLPNTVVATISVGGGSSPFDLAITPDNTTVYVTEQSGNVAYFPVGNTSPTVQFISGFSVPQGIAIGMTISPITPSGGIWDILVQFANALSISFSPASGDRSLAATIAPHSPFNVTVSPSQGLWDIVFNMGNAVGSNPSPEQGVRELLVNMAPFV